MNVMKIRDGKADFLFALKDEDGTAILENLNTVDSIDSSIFLLADIFFENANNFLKYSQSIIDESLKRGPDFIYDFGKYQRNSSRHLMAVLTSFFSLIEVTPKLITRDLGEEQIGVDFLEKVKGLENDYFEFRFIRKFRNYVQHYNLPFRNLDMNFMIHPQKVLEGIVELNRDDLLKYTRWKNGPDKFDIAAELRVLPQGIILEPIVAKLLKYTTELLDFTIPKVIDKFAPALYNIVKLHIESLKVGNEEQIAILIPDKEKGETKFRYLNIGFIRRVKTMYDFENAIVNWSGSE